MNSRSLNEQVAEALGLPCDRDWSTDMAAVEEDVFAWFEAAPKRVQGWMRDEFGRRAEDVYQVKGLALSGSILARCWCEALLSAALYDQRSE